MNNDWGIGAGAWKDNQPIGESVENFILENSQWVLYMRRDPRFNCPKHRSPSQLSASQLEEPCNICYGFGVKVDPIIIPTRITLKEPSVNYRESDNRSAPGWIEYFTAAADVPRAVMPSLEDQILICSWDKPSQSIGKYPRSRVISIESVYVIKQINDYFERELSHYGLGLQSQDFDVEKLKIHLPVLQDVPILQFKHTILPRDRQWGRNNYW